MTEHNTKEQVENSANDNTPTENAETKQHSQPKTNKSVKDKPSRYFSIKSLFIFFTFLLSVAALAISSWSFYQNTQQQLPSKITKLSRQQSLFENHISASAVNQSQLQAVTSQVATLRKDQLSQQQSVSETQNKQNLLLESFSAKLKRLNNTTKEDWKLAEAEYLIRLANQHLLLESNSQNAISLLKSADDILNELKDPIVFETRKALSSDIQALKAIKVFDIEGAYLKLNTLYVSLDSLPQKAPSKEWQQDKKEQTNETNTSTNKITSTLKDFWKAVRSLVTVHYNAKPIQALLPTTQYQELITGLQLQLEIAQVALLKEEAVIYQHTLSKVQNAVTNYFDIEAESVTSFLNTLATLQSVNPDSQPPQPRASLLSIKALVKEWYREDSSISTSDTEQQILSGDDA